MPQVGHWVSGIQPAGLAAINLAVSPKNIKQAQIVKKYRSPSTQVLCYTIRVKQQVKHSRVMQKV